jgi:hypothetical protein
LQVDVEGQWLGASSLSIEHADDRVHA